MFLDILKLVLTIPFLLFLPGFFLLLAFFGWKSAPGGEKMPFFERAVLVVPLSLVAVDFVMLFLDKARIFLSGGILVSAVAVFCLVCYAVFQFRFKKKAPAEKEKPADQAAGLYDFSFWQALFVVVSIALAIFIRSSYLADTIVPSATDMGHHIYWSQLIVDKGTLPDYGMPDFIIGEHMIFAAVNLVSGIGLKSAMPALILFLANVWGIFALAILAARMFRNKKITAAVFLTAGVLYAISAPQGKYVSGGVVGNIFGDLLIPVALYFLFRALREKDSVFAGLFIFSAAGLFYTHHLSGFVLLYSIAAAVLAYLALNFTQVFKIIGDWLKIFFKPFPFAVLAFGLCILIFVYTPSFLEKSAIGQATGEPTKITRVGLNFEQLETNAGSARLILGALGFFLLFFGFRRKEYYYSFALSWLAVIFLMSWKPAWLYVNVPSNRIGNYLFLPLSLLAAYGLVNFFTLFKKTATQFFSTVLLFVFMFFIITNGLADSADEFKVKNQFQEAMQTFHSAAYLAKTVDTGKDVILKDHVNIYGDSWYKLFFMKDYKYPLSRGNLSRYVDPTQPRETCTRDMIAAPQSDQGQACFRETGVDYIALNARLEGNSFEKYDEFSKVYASNYISIFKKD